MLKTATTFVAILSATAAFAQDDTARRQAVEVAARVPLERAVKGAPYSAETMIESSQALSDGNRINNKTTGRVYRDGLSVQANPAEAARLFRLAANQGNWRAQYYLGNFYKDGITVAVDKTEAARLYRLAADQNVPAEPVAWTEDPFGPDPLNQDWAWEAEEPPNSAALPAPQIAGHVVEVEWETGGNAFEDHHERPTVRFAGGQKSHHQRLIVYEVSAPSAGRQR